MPKKSSYGKPGGSWIPDSNWAVKGNNGKWRLVFSDGYPSGDNISFADGPHNRSTAQAIVDKNNRQGNKGKKKNPGAAAIAKEFHGRPVREIIDVDEEEIYPDDLAVIGILTELNILCDGGKNIIPIRFSAAKGKEVFVATADGESIVFVGGDQNIVNLSSLATNSRKDMVNVGKVYSIVYLADKHHLKGSTGRVEEYEHNFGKKTWFGFGDKTKGQPELVQDTVNKKLLLVGGTYCVKDVGIVD